MKELNNNITPGYIQGFVDAEGMFGLIVQKGGGPTGNKFSLEFKISQKGESLPVLLSIKDFFGCGRIAIDNRIDGTMKYVVTDLNSILTVIIPFFTKHMLLGSKCLNFLDFVRMSEIISSKQHLTLLGAQELLQIYASMNSKRSWLDKYTFLSTHSIKITKQWLSGFIDGDGCLESTLITPTGTSMNNSLQLRLSISQSTHEILLLNAILVFLGFGNISPKVNCFNVQDVYELSLKRSVVSLSVNNVPCIIELLDNHPLWTTKRHDYEDWKKLYSLRCDKQHLTPTGIALINQLRSGMNSKRKHGSFIVK